jgi:hypothetical protein
MLLDKIRKYANNIATKGCLVLYALSKKCLQISKKIMLVSVTKVTMLEMLKIKRAIKI